MQYFGPDGLGSVRQIFDASAVVVGSTRYDPFGNVMSQGAATSILAFAGEQYDAATGLEYLGARYYSAAQGRFTTRDPWEGNYALPGTLDHWVYVRDNPVNYLDPSGLIDPGAAEVAAQLLVDNLLSTYNVRITKDWGRYTTHDFSLADLGTVTKTCGWNKGAWELRELWWVYEAVDKTSAKMGGPGKFQSAMEHQVVNIARRSILNLPSPVTWPVPVSGLAADITLDRIEVSEEYALYSTIHELGHLWDLRTGGDLSRRMSDFLGTKLCTKFNLGTVCNFYVWAQPEEPAGTIRTQLDFWGNPLAYAATNRFEDWAEAFQDVVNPGYFPAHRQTSAGTLRRWFVETEIRAIQ